MAQPPICANERKGYFLHHTPVLPAASPDPVMCSREKTKPKHGGREQNHFSLWPRFRILSARPESGGASRLAVKPLLLLMIHGQSGCGKSSYTWSQSSTLGVTSPWHLGAYSMKTPPKQEKPVTALPNYSPIASSHSGHLH